jgi:hypothetical protein
MGDQTQMQTVMMKLRPSEHYFIGGMLMLRGRLTRVQWNIFESTADAICDCVLDQLPVDHPKSAVWDNRRKGDQGAPQ